MRVSCFSFFLEILSLVLIFTHFSALFIEDLIRSRRHSKVCLKWLEVKNKVHVGVYRPLPGEEFLLSNPQADKTVLNEVIEAWKKKDVSKPHKPKDALFVYDVNLNSFLPPLAFRPEQLKAQREKRKQQIAEHKSQLRYTSLLLLFLLTRILLLRFASPSHSPPDISSAC
jgi:hypothetical protein